MCVVVVVCVGVVCVYGGGSVYVCGGSVCVCGGSVCVCGVCVGVGMKRA